MTIYDDATFLDFRIMKLDFAVNDQFNKTGQAKVHTEFKISHDTSANRLKVNLSIFFKDKSAPFSIHLEGSGLFELKRSLTEAETDTMCHTHCTTIMFPYMREVIADISRRAGFPPLHIPQIDFTRVFKKQSTDTTLHTLH